LLKEEEPKSAPDEDDELSEKPINLKSKSEVNKANWPQDMEAVEINTEGWESRPGQSEFVDQSADSPFQVMRIDEE